MTGTPAVGSRREAGAAKVVDLEAREEKWEITPGHSVAGYTFNGQVPGPTIEARVGQKLVVRLTNSLGALIVRGEHEPNTDAERVLVFDDLTTRLPASTYLSSVTTGATARPRCSTVERIARQHGGRPDRAVQAA